MNKDDYVEVTVQGKAVVAPLIVSTSNFPDWINEMWTWLDELTWRDAKPVNEVKG